ncbi:hypothetical protein ACFO3O_11570 [Dokdonia ponticola]|uniref:Uncharacterized protein n=1 Tax=Dokdonia ponticola TaxID=2041041 RepID=A0ABV9HYF2_9FLAO
MLLFLVCLTFINTFDATAQMPPPVDGGNMGVWFLHEDGVLVDWGCALDGDRCIGLPEVVIGGDK